ncbi:hypothetical protein [Massilia sp. LjRoot122]|uniref:hypothetical protein n=1 Tax=Massilia sp. LjRoot122 TaxID=3342257 RepID=UPI003ECD3477
MTLVLRAPSCRRASSGGVRDVVRDGSFITGAASEELARQEAAALVSTGWSYLDCDATGCAPLDWIAQVRQHGWFERDWSTRRGLDGRGVFEAWVDQRASVSAI